MHSRAILPNSNDIPFTCAMYSLLVRVLPVGCTSINLRMRPDFASVILTGLFVPSIRNVWNRILYIFLYFSLTIISSPETRLLSTELSSILLRSPSCCIATRGLLANASNGNAPPPTRSLAINGAVYPSSNCSTRFRNVDLPVPPGPTKTMNF